MEEGWRKRQEVLKTMPRTGKRILIVTGFCLVLALIAGLFVGSRCPPGAVAQVRIKYMGIYGGQHTNPMVSVSVSNQTGRMLLYHASPDGPALIVEKWTNSSWAITEEQNAPYASGVGVLGAGAAVERRIELLPDQAPCRVSLYVTVRPAWASLSDWVSNFPLLGAITKNTESRFSDSNTREIHSAEFFPTNSSSWSNPPNAADFPLTPRTERQTNAPSTGGKEP